MVAGQLTFGALAMFSCVSSLASSAVSLDPSVSGLAETLAAYGHRLARITGQLGRLRNLIQYMFDKAVKDYLEDYKVAQRTESRRLVTDIKVNLDAINPLIKEFGFVATCIHIAKLDIQFDTDNLVTKPWTIEVDGVEVKLECCPREPNEAAQTAAQTTSGDLPKSIQRAVFTVLDNLKIDVRRVSVEILQMGQGTPRRSGAFLAHHH